MEQPVRGLALVISAESLFALIDLCGRLAKRHQELRLHPVRIRVNGERDTRPKGPVVAVSAAH
ncbi:hypothetical protein ACFV2H_08265 [Streptomyces sp. NPDC059629]|uniref:hypothetical protein n=1 Tax=Streptomyces sp. NPDC059629 TaxID=3346889 RepID=UPI0036B6FBF1